MAAGALSTSLYHAAAINPRLTNNAAQLFLLGLPPQQDVGHITSDSFLPIYLWNGSAADAVLNSVIGNSEAEGFSWDIAPPAVIATHESALVIITISDTGPLVFTAGLTFTSTCNVITLTLTGTRAPKLTSDVGMLFHPHNWAEGWNESYEWKTDVMIAWDRTEQRIRLRSLPRRRFDLRLVVAGDERRQLETTMTQRRSVQMFTPLWRDLSTLTADLPANTSTIPMAEDTDNYVVGSLLAVWTDVNTFELREISGIGSGYLAVALPLLKEWPAGANIAPCRYCLCDGPRSVSRFTEDVGEYKMRLLAVDDKWVPSASVDPEQYQGLPVFPLPASWETPSQTYDNKWTLLDSDTGIIEVDVQSREPVLERSLKMVIFGRVQVNRLLAFLSYCAGRQAPFWVSGDDRGFELSATAEILQTFIVIKPIGYAFNFHDCPSRAHIEMVTLDGLVIRRRILGVETLPTFEEKLTLDAALPVEISAATLNRCAWLEKVRLNTDSVDLKWHTSECVETNLAIVVLP